MKGAVICKSKLMINLPTVQWWGHKSSGRFQIFAKLSIVTTWKFDIELVPYWWWGIIPMWYLLCYCNESAKKFESHHFCLLKVKLIFFQYYNYLPTSWNQTTMSEWKGREEKRKKLRLAFWLGIFIITTIFLPTTKKKQTVHLNFKSCFVRLFSRIFFWMVHIYAYQGQVVDYNSSNDSRR